MIAFRLSHRESPPTTRLDDGRRREQMLPAHRVWAGPDDVLLVFTNDSELRRRHTQLKAELKIDEASPLTKAKLNPPTK